MNQIRPIHPFPARMASEIALEACESLPEESTILDPMAGSGTVLRMAAENGHVGVGFDMDPMAVLLAKVWTTPISTTNMKVEASRLVEEAKILSEEEISLPWIDEDEETKEFIDFWYVQPQKSDLRKLSSLLHGLSGAISDALRVAVSRLIITKKRGASLAGDVSHSRPHRIREENDFEVFEEFERSVEWLARRLDKQAPPGNVKVGLGDARRLENVDDNSIDAVITSPPYLNAIDYLRGHRMSLVWFGHQIRELRDIRSNLVGAERIPEADADRNLAKELTASMGEEIDDLPSRKRRMIDRYALDMYASMKEVERVLKPGGKAVFVIGNSCHRGIFVENTKAALSAAERFDLELRDRSEREIPPSRRYLPPPSQLSESDLKKRMRTETVLRFEKQS